MKYKRILLKMSGDLFSDENNSFDYNKLKTLAFVLVEFQKKYEVELAVVVGAGNIWRYRDNTSSGLPRLTSDKMGMTATVFNAVLLAEKIKEVGGESKVHSAFPIADLALDYSADAAKASMEKGKIVLLAGGTGYPFCTTDLAAVLRALELDCDVVYKATKVDGVYDKDPMKNDDAKRFDTLSYQEALELKLKIMDLTAFGMACENSLKIMVFDFTKYENLDKVYLDSSLGTLIY